MLSLRFFPCQAKKVALNLLCMEAPCQDWLGGKLCDRGSSAASAAPAVQALCVPLGDLRLDSTLPGLYYAQQGCSTP